MKKTSTIKKAQMGASTPALPPMSKKIKGIMNPTKSSKPTRSTLPNKFKEKPVYEGSTLPEYTVTAPKAKAGKSLGMKSVKAGYDNNPAITRADIISAAKMKGAKAKNGTKVAAKKPIKKAQTGTTQYMELPEANVTASRIVDKPSKAAKPQKNYTKNLIKRSNKMNKNQSGFSRMNPRKRFEEGGDVSMAKKGASVKKAMGKCKMGC